MLRTQIYLPEDLRRKIDSARRKSGESLSKYLRSSAHERVKREKIGKLELKRLAKEIVGSVDPKESGWAGVNIDRWQREIRKDRKII